MVAPLPPPERHKSPQPTAQESDLPRLPGRPPTPKRAGKRRHATRNKKGNPGPPTTLEGLLAAGAYRLAPAATGSHSATPSEVKRQARLVRNTLKLLYPKATYDLEAIKLRVWEAHRSADDEYGMEEAIEWAEGYTFPPDIHVRDETDLLAHDGDLASMCQDHHTRMSSGGARMSRESIARMCAGVIPPDDPDYILLEKLVDGIEIVVPDTFVPCSSPPPLRAKYVKVAPAVNKLMAELHARGLIFIVPTAAALRIQGRNFGQTHWAFKKGKRQGRPIGDASNKEDGCDPLNSDEVKAMVDAIYGKIEHPTLASLADMVKDMNTKHGSANTVLWKLDLKGAFTLLFVDPATCQRLMFALTDDLVMIYHVGMFGWTGMPAAFQVVTRVITRLVTARLAGSAKMYVDDLMGCCHVDDLEHDLAVAREICNGLLGIGAVEESKTSHGRQQDFIGWRFDLDNESVAVAQHNYLKTFNGFLQLDTERGVRVRDIQRVASWASRYSAICRSLKPFTQDLFDMIRGKTTHAAIKWTERAARAVKVWRATLLALQMDPLHFERPLHTLGARCPTFLLEYDASLTGIGLVISAITSDLPRRLICGAQISIRSFGFEGIPGRQNTCEFIAVIAGLACLGSLGVRGAGVKIIGDNVSSLQWCGNLSFHSQASKTAAIMFMAVSTTCDLQVVETEHIRGEWNLIPDNLSRDHTLESQGFTQDEVFSLEDHPLVTDIVRACDPAHDVDRDEATFYQQWGTSFSLAKSLAMSALDARIG